MVACISYVRCGSDADALSPSITCEIEIEPRVKWRGHLRQPHYFKNLKQSRFSHCQKMDILHRYKSRNRTQFKHIYLSRSAQPYAPLKYTLYPQPITPSAYISCHPHP